MASFFGAKKTASGFRNGRAVKVSGAEPATRRIATELNLPYLRSRCAQRIVKLSRRRPRDARAHLERRVTIGLLGCEPVGQELKSDEANRKYAHQRESGAV